MEFGSPLLEGRLISRYKRFFADIRLVGTGEIVTAHCPNPGSMLGLIHDNGPVYVSRADNPRRKLKYTWELVRDSGNLIGINTGLTNRIVEEALSEGRIRELSGYAEIKREAPFGVGTRFDFLLRKEESACWVEVKNVTLVRNSIAAFPDSVTARGTRHLKELIEAVRQGYRSVILFVIQRMDAGRFVPASDIDPVFSDTLGEAVDSGVDVIIYRSEVSTERIRIAEKLPFEI